MSMHTQRWLDLLLKGEENLLTGRLEQCVISYEQASKLVQSGHLQRDIRCSLSVLYHSCGRNREAIELAQKVLKQPESAQGSATLKVRVVSNLIMMKLANISNSPDTDSVKFLLKLLDNERYPPTQRKQLCEYAYYLFFRVKSAAELDDYLITIDTLQNYSVPEALFTCSLVCNAVKLKHHIKHISLLDKFYKYFVNHARYDLAVVPLLTLTSDIELSLKDYYEKELGKLAAMGYLQQKHCLSTQYLDTIRHISASLALLHEKSVQEISGTAVLCERDKTDESICSNHILFLWRLVLKILRMRNIEAKEFDSVYKKWLCGYLHKMENEKCLLIIHDAMRNKLFTSVKKEIKQCLSRVMKIIKTFYTLSIKESKLRIQQYSKNPKRIIQDLKISLLPDTKKMKNTSQASHRSTSNKQNLGISVVSCTSQKGGGQSNRKRIFPPRYQSNNNGLRRAAKYLKLCEHGSFLNKRNYNSEGGEFKFVKVTQQFIKWGKDPQKIQSNSQAYPLKEVRSIFYGRVSPNLNRGSNKLLTPSKCFSLLLNQRTLDFYCKDHEQVQTWICGLSYLLKKNGNQLVGYTLGKLLWKRLFAILKQHFVETLKPEERNKYYYENAFAVIQFGKNNYKLPRLHR